MYWDTELVCRLFETDLTCAFAGDVPHRPIGGWLEGVYRLHQDVTNFGQVRDTTAGGEMHRNPMGMNQLNNRFCSDDIRGPEGLVVIPKCAVRFAMEDCVH